MTITEKNINRLFDLINDSNPRSAWDKGVREYALDLIENIMDSRHADNMKMYNDGEKLTEAVLLNGAANWRDFSYGGCSFIYDSTIAARLCTKSELKRTDNAQKNPNPRETWLDVQARALFQAAKQIMQAAATINE